MRRIILGTAAGLATTLAAQPASASGFLAARFGGEHGHPTTSNPTAMYYNPAGLALGSTYNKYDRKKEGWNFSLYLDGSFAYRTATYERPEEAISNLREPNGSDGFTPLDAVGANSGEATLGDFIASPFAAVTTNFGLENFGAGVAVYVPFGGVASWDENEDWEGNARYPGAADGVQRWWTMDGRIQSLYVTGAAAYQIPALRLSVGVGVNAVQSTVHTIRARNLDGSDDLVLEDGTTIKEGRSYLDTSGWDLSLSGGVIWEPVDRLWVGVSYQSQPGFGEMVLDGTLDTVLADGQPGVTDVELQQELPDVWRFGARWQFDRQWEARLFGEYARWSVFDRQCIVNAANAECDLAENGAEITGDGSVIQNIPRNWDDAFGLRGGVSYWFTQRAEGYIGLGYDGNAVPDETLDPALIDMTKYTLAIGGEFALASNWVLSGTFTQVIYNERNVEVEDVTTFEAPSAQPNAAGRYNQSVSVLNVYTQYTF
ncbi:OmpP1/FadL family transporter [Vulgatibacter sp.]|uniref:OmpP1/FadL family transporter n=1 Tax=Vulgatibacter sp. TaxID=1971226 RepID=UPI0035676928